jgi:hypothetical protein
MTILQVFKWYLVIVLQKSRIANVKKQKIISMNDWTEIKLRENERETSDGRVGEGGGVLEGVVQLEVEHIRRQQRQNESNKTPYKVI